MKKILVGFIAMVMIFSFVSVVFAGGKQEAKGTTALPIKTTSMDDLIAKAKKEGVLVSYGLPDDWVNYGGIMKIMKDKYGIKDMDTDMGSGTIISTLKSEKNAPVADSTDLGFNFATVITADGLSQPYKNQHWNEIPDYAKDPNGLWSAAYWGTIAFTVNTDIVKNIPKTWADLLKPEYKNMVCIKDPRESGTANMMVLAAAYANGGSVDNVRPGIEYFKKLKKAGNIKPVRPSTSAIQKGEAPIALFWDFDGLSKKYSLGMDSLKIVIPQDGTVAGMYIQFITAGAPHPYAARLLIETEYSDAGQIEYAKGFVHPIRKSVKLPAELAAKFPPAEDYKVVSFVKDASVLGKAAKEIAKEWDEVAAIQ
ncbi:MAG: ABC transporter substrate-binding protein [Spirochaetes bacterium]|nr:MAG: ABC transporter substrate-binding protein [Spirochaetota bacterium]